MKTIGLIITLGAVSLLTACGGGGGGGSTPNPVNNSINGVASVNIIKGGTVKAFMPYSSLTGADKKQVGADSQTSITDGSYTVNLGSYNGPVIIEVTGGSYIDVANVSAGPKSIPANTPLRAAVSSSDGNVKVSVTPLTELAVKRAQALDITLGANSIDRANAEISDLFKVDIINITPMNASFSISGGTEAEKDYTIALATISRLTLTSAQTLDATLGNLAGNISGSGGMTANSASAIMTALTTFLADTTNNRTGVSTVSSNLSNLGTSTFKLTIALTGTGVRSVETTLLLPDGVSVSADVTGATLEGVLTQSISGSNPELSGKFTPAAAGAATLHLILLSPEATIGEGDIVTVTFNLTAGASVPVAMDFTQKSNSTILSDINGVEVIGSLALHL